MGEWNQTLVGGIVLCGGKSSRMGRPKAWLAFGEETALQRVVRILSEVVDPIVVVAGPNQDLPPLPDGVSIVRDPDEHLGPLAGIANGLAAVRPFAEAAYVTGCDVPLLQRCFVRAVIGRLGDAELAVPVEEGGSEGGTEGRREGGIKEKSTSKSSRSPDSSFILPPSSFIHPLAGVYRTSLAERARSLVSAGQLRPLFLIEQSNAVTIPVEELRAVDPELDSLKNMNTPEDYEQLLRRIS